MPDIKNISILSEWLTFELETTWFDPPVIKLKIGPIMEDIPIADMVDNRNSSPSEGDIVSYKLYDAIQDWDFTSNGQKVPLTRQNKQRILRPLLGLKLKGENQILGTKLLVYASNKENFLKNSKPT